MNITFDPHANLVVIPAEIESQDETAILRLAVDTGATVTFVSLTRLMEAGYDPATSTDRFEVTTGSGIEYVSRVFVSTLTALGTKRRDFPAYGHALPPSSSVDGVLGLDFFRGQNLNIDFRNGFITLS